MMDSIFWFFVLKTFPKKFRSFLTKKAIEKAYKSPKRRLIRLAKANEAFRKFEKRLSQTNIPDNLANKFMSLLLSSLDSFELVATRYQIIRNKIQGIHVADRIYIDTHSEDRVRPAHPDEEFTSAAIRVDAESLFIFGIIIVRRTLPLIRLFLPDNPSTKTFDDIHDFYVWISANKNLSHVAGKMFTELHGQFRWLYSVLRFYRNKFIEHLNDPRQQGMNFNISGKSFALHSYKWGIDKNDENEIMTIKNALEKDGVVFPKEMNPRHYVQILFNNIINVPGGHLETALRLIDKIGIDSPEPTILIGKIDDYLASLFNFMDENFSDSNLVQYVTKK